MIRTLITALAFLFITNAKASIVDTVSIYSNAMHKEFKCVVIKPGSYKKNKTGFPVVYILHGYGGIGKEVPGYIDEHYKTIKDRKARAITGLSMGGHGGLFLGFRHADYFGACGSMSGGVDLNFSRNKFDVVKRIGDTINYASNWKNYSVINVVENYPKDSLAIIFDCGTEDFFYNNNHALHEWYD